MRVLILDGHPDEGRLTTDLLDTYAAALPPGTVTERIAVRDLSFEPNLRRGYAAVQTLEPDLDRLTAAILACDHLVVAFPMWWGAEPARLKGLLDRVLLPGVAFRYHEADPFWDRLLVGRSADAIIVMDTPPWFLRVIYGNAVVRRWRGQVLGFCGFKPVRIMTLGPSRQEAARRLPEWRRRLERAAGSVNKLHRAPKRGP